MKGMSLLAVAICVACFFIGYLAYLGTALIADAVMSRFQTCQNTAGGCVATEPDPSRR